MNMQDSTERVPLDSWKIAPPLTLEERLINVHSMKVSDAEGVCLPSGITVPSQLLTVPLLLMHLLYVGFVFVR